MEPRLSSPKGLPNQVLSTAALEAAADYKAFGDQAQQKRAETALARRDYAGGAAAAPAPVVLPASATIASLVRRRGFITS
jgi:hypothetical protein